MKRFIKIRPAALAAGAMLLAGCADQKIHVYTVPKEEKVPLAASHDNHQHGQAGPGHLHWELPAGWKEEKPDRLRVASFSVIGDGGKMAQVAVIPLPGVAGIEVDSLNMWREELGLTPIKTEEFASQAKEVTVGGAKGHLVDIVANEAKPGKDFKTRTTGVILPREGTLWFIKMTGEDSLVTAQKEQFDSFLNTLQFHASAADHGPKKSVVSANTDQLPPTAGLPKWTPPAHWQAKPPGSMVVAAYTVTGSEGKADVSISKLGADYGGLLPNVQRWQRQLGIEGSKPEDLDKVVSAVAIDGKHAPLVDLLGKDLNSGDPARTIVVVIAGSGETWFYKLMGSPATVGAEKDNLVKFIEEAH